MTSVDAADMALAKPTLPREISPGVFWFGCCIDVMVDGQLVHNHTSCYLLIGKTKTVLVDTGMPFTWRRELRRELLTVLNGRPLDYVFPTHPEAPHMGNIGPMIREFPGLKIVGDMRNYHLYYPGEEHRFMEVAEGDHVELGGRRLQLVEAAVHDLPNSLWGYEPDAQILFASDAFPLTHGHNAGQCAMTSEELPQIKVEDTGVVISRALGWARYVDTDVIVKNMHAFLREHPVRMIAPAHGAVATNPAEIALLFERGLYRARV